MLSFVGGAQSAFVCGGTLALVEAFGHLRSHIPGTSAPGDKLPSSQRSRQLPLGFDGPNCFIDLGATELVRQTRML